MGDYEFGWYFGSSASPTSLTYNGTKAMAIYTTCASTNASTNFEPVYINTVQTGAGQVGGRVRVNLESNVVMGGWANALKASVDWKTNGGVTGLGAVFCAEMTMPASASSGTFCGVEIEMTCPASWAGKGEYWFISCNASGATVANFDDYGYLFSLTGLTSGSAHCWYDHQGNAPASVEEWIRIKTPAGIRYLAVYNAVV